tara:strand:+ start:107 stop:391 length:285 start_codon:yes stop_codon:yes gene_type:complete
MSDIRDLHPQKPDAQENPLPNEMGAANEGDRTAVLKAKLQALLSEHRDLDDVIARLTDTSVSDRLQMQRLKKRKLALKDEISRLHALVLPDIIA